jgi:hypothetical protein
MTLDEVRQSIQRVQGTLAVLQGWLNSVMEELQTAAPEVEVEVRHGKSVSLVRKPNPAMRRSREIISSIQSFERALRKLRAAEQQLVLEEQKAQNPFSKFSPNRRKDHDANDSHAS